MKRRTSPLSASDATRYATIQASVTAVPSHLSSPDAWWQLFQHLDTVGLFLANKKYKLSSRPRGLDKMLNLLQAQQTCGPGMWSWCALLLECRRVSHGGIHGWMLFDLHPFRICQTYVAFLFCLTPPMFKRLQSLTRVFSSSCVCVCDV